MNQLTVFSEVPCFNVGKTCIHEIQGKYYLSSGYTGSFPYCINETRKFFGLYALKMLKINICGFPYVDYELPNISQIYFVDDLIETFTIEHEMRKIIIFRLLTGLTLNEEKIIVCNGFPISWGEIHIKENIRIPQKTEKRWFNDISLSEFAEKWMSFLFDSLFLTKLEEYLANQLIDSQKIVDIISKNICLILS